LEIGTVGTGRPVVHLDIYMPHYTAGIGTDGTLSRGDGVVLLDKKLIATALYGYYTE